MALFNSILVRRSAFIVTRLIKPLLNDPCHASPFVTDAINPPQLSPRLSPISPSDKLYSSHEFGVKLEPIEVEEIPSDFPFKFKYDPTKQTVTMTKAYQDEEIKVHACMANIRYFVSGPWVSLIVSVSKKNGLTLEISCLASPDRISFHRANVHNANIVVPEDGPVNYLFWDSQQPLYKYLENRGFDSSTINLLYKYMINKYNNEKLAWLMKLEKFNEEVPNGFLFEIEDDPAQQTITLRRTFQDEETKVQARMADFILDDHLFESYFVKDDHRSLLRCEFAKDDHLSGCHVPLIVTVSKKNGPILDIRCVAYLGRICIDHVNVKNANYNMQDEIASEGPALVPYVGLHKALNKYLETRVGLNATDFLLGYMFNKKLLWPKMLEKLIGT